MFTGNSDGFIDIYFQNEAGKYDHVLNYWLGREGLELKKEKMAIVLYLNITTVI
jgi:hypothetical protein